LSFSFSSASSLSLTAIRSRSCLIFISRYSAICCWIRFLRSISCFYPGDKLLSLPALPSRTYSIVSYPWRVLTLITGCFTWRMIGTRVRLSFRPVSNWVGEPPLPPPLLKKSFWIYF
jgi:hypothetical protein